MIQVRRGVFETNSSSTHSITIAPQSEFDKWVNGEIYFHEYVWDDEEQWLTKDEAINYVIISGYYGGKDLFSVSDEELDELLADEYGIYTYDNYFNDDWYETYQEPYVTEHGEEIMAFGKYGHD